MEAAGFAYDSSLMADDDPYELLEEGRPTGVVELPPEWIRDDFPYFNMDRFSGLRPHTPPESVLGIWQAEFDGALAEGGLFLLTMHPHVIGPRSRMAMLEELIRSMRSFSGGRYVDHVQVAAYGKAEEIRKGGEPWKAPSRLSSHSSPNHSRPATHRAEKTVSAWATTSLASRPMPRSPR